MGSLGRPTGWREARRLLRGPLRTLVSGQALGQAGDGLAQIAFAQLVVFEIGRGATPGRIAGVLAATLLPYSVVGPFAGVFIDRWDRRRTLIVLSGCRAALAALGVGIAVTRSEPLAYAAVLLMLSFSRFVLAAKGAVLPRTVAARDLVTANALSGLIGMSATFLGAVGGALFVAASTPAAFAVAASAYLTGGLVFVRLPDVGGHLGGFAAGTESRSGVARLRRIGRELADGVRAIVRDSDVRRPLLAVWAHRLLLGAGFVLLVLVADSRYHLQAGGYGLALAVTGVAAFAGTVAAPWLGRRWAPWALLPVAFLPPAVAALLAANEPTVGWLLAALAVAAVSFQILKVLADALVGAATDDAVRGRVFASYDLLYNLAFVMAGLAMVPLWQPGKERALLWWLAAAFAASWLILSWRLEAWPFLPARAAAPVGHRWWWRAATALAGALPVLAFPKPGLWWLAWVALVPWMLLIRGAPSAREAALRGWYGAVGFLLGMHYWLLPDVTVFIVPIVAGLALLWVPWGALAWSVLSGRTSWRRAVAAGFLLPAGWVAIEAIRSWSSLGGPWGLLGASQWQVPVMLASASLGGVWLVSYLVVAANTVCVLLITARSAWGRVAAGAAAVGAVLSGPLWFAVQAPPPVGPVVRLALVQPGVIGPAEQRFDAAEAITRDLPPGRYGLVVWGESSVGFDLDRRPDLLARLRRLSVANGSDLLVNVDAVDASGAIHKTSVLIGPDGVVSRYEKMRLVPFGEYVPFRRALGWLPSITRAASEDRARGEGLVVMRADGIRFAPLVCFESAFPDMSRRAALDGARLVVVQSATTTFQGSWAPDQHASLAAVRAVETGRPVVHATLSGTSAGYDEQGRRLAWFDTHHHGEVVISLPVATRRTPYLRYGNWVLAWSFTILAAGAAAASVRVRPRGATP